MGAVEAVKFLKKDHGDVVEPSGFRKIFAEDQPYKSILQRNGATLEDMRRLFDWHPDDDAWRAEYDNDMSNQEALIKFRRRVCFAACGWREVNEDFGRGDVSCLRDIRTPLVTSRTPLRAMEDEFEPPT